MTGPHAEDGGQSLDENGPFTAISTFTGHAFDLVDPWTWTYGYTEQVNDIANALACLTRYNGHTKFYSVAEHSLRVADHLELQGEDEMTQLLGLWHDATEAYIGDVPRPQKKMMCLSIKDPYDEYYWSDKIDKELASWDLKKKGLKPLDSRLAALSAIEDAKEYEHDRRLSVKLVPFEEFEHDMALKIFAHFGIEYNEERWAAVKAADYAVYVVERSERPYPAMVGKRAMTPDLAETHWQLRNKRLMDSLFPQ
jgi:hypothetical protein